MTGEGTDGRGLVFNIQRFSIHDGPGIRTTVFLKGCPLRCEWCSNPESMGPLPEIITRDVKCIRCGVCIEVCPQRAITAAENARIIEWKKCNQCLKCAETCPSGAIETVGKQMTVAEALGAVKRDRNFYRRTGGGMTVSGGEPLMQWQFTRSLLQEAKRKGFHTALDTTGCADWEVLDELLRYVDLMLFDVKQLNSEKHKHATGLGNEQILDNLRRAASEHRTNIWIRYPVIPQFNDSETDLEKLSRLVLSLGSVVEKVSLLPYHKFGEQKYSAMGVEYPYRNATLLDEEYVGRLKEVIESFNVRVDVSR